MPLPPALQLGIAQLAEGEARGALATRAADLSAGYRDRRASAATVADNSDVAAYALTRLPATYASLEAALQRLANRMPGFVPKTLLDLGCGPGTASWAALEAFPSIERATLIDSSPPFLAAARELASGHPVLSDATISHGNIAAPPEGPFDLIIVGYALTELPDPAAVIDRLWSATAGVLVIVEPGTPRDYRRLMSARTKLIELGATIAAPCPHDLACPIVAPDWCHFSVRLNRSRDHMRLKGGSLGYEDEKYSYLAAARQTSGVEPRAPVVLAPPFHSKFDVRLKLCTPSGIEQRSVSKRDPAFKAAKKLDWGDEA